MEDSNEQNLSYAKRSNFNYEFTSSNLIMFFYIPASGLITDPDP